MGFLDKLWSLYGHCKNGYFDEKNEDILINLLKNSLAVALFRARFNKFAIDNSLTTKEAGD